MKNQPNKFVARSMTIFFRFVADTFFKKKYGQRALVLETVAGVPGMVAGMLTHLRSLRYLQRGNGAKIHEMLEEAENERKHLMFFMEIIKPSWIERTIIILAQFVFWHFYLVMYILFPRTSHLMIHYFEEEAVRSYTEYLRLIEDGEIEDIPAPQIAIEYYDLPRQALLSHMIHRIKMDEAKHAHVNLLYATKR